MGHGRRRLIRPWRRLRHAQLVLRVSSRSSQRARRTGCTPTTYQFTAKHLQVNRSTPAVLLPKAAGQTPFAITATICTPLATRRQYNFYNSSCKFFTKSVSTLATACRNLPAGLLPGVLKCCCCNAQVRLRRRLLELQRPQQDQFVDRLLGHLYGRATHLQPGRAVRLELLELHLERLLHLRVGGAGAGHCSGGSAAPAAVSCCSVVCVHLGCHAAGPDLGPSPYRRRIPIHLACERSPPPAPMPPSPPFPPRPPNCEPSWVIDMIYFLPCWLEGYDGLCP
jgi:hypothetical protein